MFDGGCTVKGITGGLLARFCSPIFRTSPVNIKSGFPERKPEMEEIGTLNRCAIAERVSPDCTLYSWGIFFFYLHLALILETALKSPEFRQVLFKPLSCQIGGHNYRHRLFRLYIFVESHSLERSMIKSRPPIISFSRKSLAGV